MLVQVVYVFDNAVFKGSTDADVVNYCQVLDIFAEADTAGMGANGDAEFGGQEHNGQDFVDPTEAAAINLAEADGFGLHQLLKHNTVLAMFAGSNADGGNGAGNAGVAEDVVGAGRFFNPPGAKLGQVGHPLNSLLDFPDLVGVYH